MKSVDTDSIDEYLERMCAVFRFESFDKIYFGAVAVVKHIKKHVTRHTSHRQDTCQTCCQQSRETRQDKTVHDTTGTNATHRYLKKLPWWYIVSKVCVAAIFYIMFLERLCKECVADVLGPLAFYANSYTAYLHQSMGKQKLRNCETLAKIGAALFSFE